MTTLTTAEELISSPDMCRQGGCTYRQLDWWSRTGVIRPHIDATGSGSRRGFTHDQVRQVRLATLLSAVGCPHPLIADLVDVPRDWTGLLFVPAPDSDGIVGWTVDLDACADPVPFSAPQPARPEQHGQQRRRWQPQSAAV